MNKFDSKKRTEERKKVQEAATLPYDKVLIEKDETVTKFLAGNKYEGTDMRKCAENVFVTAKNKYDFMKQFRLVESVQKINEELKDLDVKKPVFVILARPDSTWVLFSIVQKEPTQKKVLVFYKDPSGDGVPAYLSEKLDVLFSNVIYTAHPQIQLTEEDNENVYGPLTTRNLKVFLDFFSTSTDSEKFLELNFPGLKNIEDAKLKKIMDLIEQLRKEEKFLVSVKAFVNNLPLEYAANVKEYQTILQEEMQKDEALINHDRIKAAKEKFANKNSVNKISKDYKINEDDSEHKLEIQEKFPDQMKKFSDIFMLLENVKVNQELFNTLKNLSDILAVNYNKLKLIYELKIQLVTPVVKPLPEDISEIVKNLPNQKNASCPQCTPLEALLEEIVLGMDEEDGVSKEKSQKDIEAVEEKYHAVKEAYEKWKDCNLHKINSWAKLTRGSLRSDDDEICEAIAIMDRAFNILTGGFRLRDPQILAVIIYFHGQNNKGRLLQIQTGEGKTIIVSLLATIKCLQGCTVDVLTSSPLLAEDGVSETKTFYSAFNLTVATNNRPDDDSTFNHLVYKADIVYGTIANFQFDFLRDTLDGSFLRCNRPFGAVVLDEVDSMLIDNGGHIAKLSSPYPGMESLKYIYIKIWQELEKAETSFAEETKGKLMEILDTYSPEEVREHYQSFVENITKNERRIIKEKIRASNPTNVPFIPPHLKEYVKGKLELWLKNALHAKYNCEEHKQFRIITNESGERVIAPVDYQNTGVTMKNTVWSNGLHQFVQLKQNLHLTFESLTCSFISNIGYIKKYSDKNIYGMTGTIGSRAEQELLSQIYKVDYAKLPTYMVKKFKEITGRVVDNHKWETEVVDQALKEIDKGRGVLVICETEKDLMSLKQQLDSIEEKNFQLRLYRNEGDAPQTKKKVRVGDIILATNIAGRGTNFKTKVDVELNGGLHVCVGFLPWNIRVEGQAFGRTARQGNTGTAQLIIRRQELERLGIDDETTHFDLIKCARNVLERERLQEINDSLVKELVFKDQLYKYFADLHRTKKQEDNSNANKYLLEDLKEFWAFWLEKKNFKAKTIKDKSPWKEFQQFKQEAKSIIDGTISYNPYYCIALSSCHIENADWKGAEAILLHAAQMNDGANATKLIGIHMKYFDVKISSGNQLMKCFQKGIQKIFFMPVESNNQYRVEAILSLENAQILLKEEIEYLNDLVQNPNADFLKIIKHEDSLFLKHIYSKLWCLKAHQNNIEELLAKLNNCEAVDFATKNITELKNLKKLGGKSVENFLTECELSELHSIGLDTLYELKEVVDASEPIIRLAQVQIGAGIGTLIAGLIFFPTFPYMSAIAGTLISDGIMEIVVYLLTQGSAEFNAKEYFMDKCLSYAISLFTFGVGAIVQTIKVATKIINVCRNISYFLLKSPRLKTVCNKLSKYVENIGNSLERKVDKMKFNKLDRSGQISKLKELKEAGDLTRFEHLGGLTQLDKLEKLQRMNRVQYTYYLFREATVSISKTVGKDLRNTIYDQVVRPEIVNMLSSKFIDIMEKSIKEKFANADLLEILEKKTENDVEQSVDDFLKRNFVVVVLERIADSFLDRINSSLLDYAAETVKGVTTMVNFCKLLDDLVVFLKNDLTKYPDTEDVNKNVENIAEKMTKYVADEFLQRLKETITLPTIKNKQARKKSNKDEQINKK